jgi:hypothetical protein
VDGSEPKSSYRATARPAERARGPVSETVRRSSAAGAVVVVVVVLPVVVPVMVQVQERHLPAPSNFTDVSVRVRVRLLSASLTKGPRPRPRLLQRLRPRLVLRPERDRCEVITTFSFHLSDLTSPPPLSDFARIPIPIPFHPRTTA